VVVDLLNVSTKLGHAFEFNDPIVKQIRIGQHPNTLRLVIDLRQTALYSVEEGMNTLSVILTPRVSPNQPLEAAVSAEPSPDLPESSSAINPVSSAGQALGQEQVDHAGLSTLEADRAMTDPRPRQDVRNRAADRRVVDQSTNQSATERYVAAFGGFSLSQSFTNVHGLGANSSVNVDDLALARTGIGGRKLGFSPSTAKWMAIETEVFYASPHFKAQTITARGTTTGSTDVSGSRTRVATWAFNWIIRYPGEWIQPYAGAGLGIFWERLADSGGTSSSDTSPGLNALAGLRIKLGQHFMLFSEYKYNRTSFDFSNSDFHVLYQAHYVVGGLGWSF
jgi:opacity protein-like surface antigen